MKTLILLAGATLLAAAPAHSKPDHSKHADKGHHAKDHHAKGHAAHGYGKGGCPPGLAKQNAECMPPGHHKKLFNVGQRLPRGYSAYTPYNQVPYDLRRKYGLDRDDRYIYRDQYLYRVDPRTMVVEQIVSALLR